MFRRKQLWEYSSGCHSPFDAWGTGTRTWADCSLNLPSSGLWTERCYPTDNHTGGGIVQSPILQTQFTSIGDSQRMSFSIRVYDRPSLEPRTDNTGGYASGDWENELIKSPTSCSLLTRNPFDCCVHRDVDQTIGFHVYLIGMISTRQLRHTIHGFLPGRDCWVGGKRFSSPDNRTFIRVSSLKSRSACILKLLLVCANRLASRQNAYTRTVQAIFVLLDSSIQIAWGTAGSLYNRYGFILLEHVLKDCRDNWVVYWMYWGMSRIHDIIFILEEYEEPFRLETGLLSFLVGLFHTGWLLLF